jgi:hypothetical protein
MNKKARLDDRYSHHDDSINVELLHNSRYMYSIQWLLAHNELTSVFQIDRIGRETRRLQRMLDNNGFRTSKVSSPREGVSVYKDSCLRNHERNDDDDDSSQEGTDFLLVTFGIHPRQEEIEKNYELLMKDSYCVLLFCQKMHQVFNLTSPKKDEKKNTCDPLTKDLQNLLNAIEQNIFSMESILKNNNTNSNHNLNSLHRSSESRIDELIRLAINLKGENCTFYRMEEWKKEYQRICVSNSTISNAYISLLQSSHGMYIDDILFRFSKVESKFERFTIYLKGDEEALQPDCFLLLPCLNAIVNKGPLFVISKMVESFWSHLLQNGYFPTARVKDSLDFYLRNFFLSGIVRTNNPIRDATALPLSLKANFDPTVPLSLFLFGLPGTGMICLLRCLCFTRVALLLHPLTHAHTHMYIHLIFLLGKSSFARSLPVGLQNTIQQHLDPECIARCVKQNLNKSINTLELELEIRPDNNNLSIMNIVQSRRMSMNQSKPGLVVLHLEEMPMSSTQSNSNQLSIAHLISQRFGGRNSNYRNTRGEGRYANDHERTTPAPRNSDKRSIGQDCSIVTIFTSNYSLVEESTLALQKLELYQSLQSIEMASISGNDRFDFSKQYLVQVLHNFSGMHNYCVDISAHNVKLNIVFTEEGDTRALVKQLRIFAFYLQRSIPKKTGRPIIVEEIQILQEGESCSISVKSKIGDGKETTQTSFQHLKIGNLNNWFPTGTFTFDSRIESKYENLKSMIGGTTVSTELAMILEFWFSMTFAPAVILSRDKKITKQLIDVIESIGVDVHCIRNINAQTYKMVKSLYDPKDTPNLKDDILRIGRGELVAVELNCPTEDSQLCIREMIEDSPSMAAFSTAQSALYKAGLLFVISTEGQEVTTEVMSRVSFVL